MSSVSSRGRTTHLSFKTPATNVPPCSVDSEYIDIIGDIKEEKSQDSSAAKDVNLMGNYYMTLSNS